MRVLVTGGTSLIGRHIGHTLEGDHEIFYAGRRNAHIRLDLMQVESSPVMDERFDVIVHCAADFGGDSPEDMLRAEMANAIGTAKLITIAHSIGVNHFILLSSCSAAYTPLDPYYSAYSMSKRHGEELAVFACRQAGLPLTILRPTSIYGASMEYAKHQPLFYHLVGRAMRGEDIVIYGRQDPERQFLHVEDLADVVVAVLEKRILGLHTVSNGRSHRISEIADLAYSVFGTGGRVHFDPSRSDIPSMMRVDHSPALASMGLFPKIELADGLRLIRDLRGVKQ